jgi:hypothetical protein
MDVVAACKEALWHLELRRDMQLHTEGPTQLWGDNQGALGLVKDPVLHTHTWHIDVHGIVACQPRSGDHLGWHAPAICSHTQNKDCCPRPGGSVPVQSSSHLDASWCKTITQWRAP